MANPTTNFGWVMPTTTSLVTNLPADFNTFGQGVDTSMAGLLGGTTGQILSKTSATNMAFTWINNDQGDITGVTAGTGISGGGTSGTVTVSIDTAVTADLTTAQTLTNKKLSDSTTTIVDVTDATKAVKFDVGGTTAITGTIATNFTTAKTITIPDATDTLVGRATTDTLTNKTLTSPTLTTPTISTATTNGDLLYGTGSGALTRLGIGSSAQVLTVASGVPSWATPASGGGMTLINTGGTTLTGSSVSISSIPATYKMLILMIDAAGTAQDGTVIRCTFNADSASRYRTLQMGLGDTISTFAQAFIQLQINMDDTVQKGFSYTVLPNYASTTSWKFAQIWSMSTDYTTDTSFGMGNYSGFYNQTTAISSIELFQNGGYNFDAGKAYLYGVN